MRHLISCFAGVFLSLTAQAGESMLATTYQPLDGLGSGTIRIVEVTCR